MWTNLPWKLKSQAEKDLIREYKRRWRAKHPEKVKEYNARSWQNHHAKRLAAKRERYRRTLDQSRPKSRAYQQAHADARDSHRHGLNRGHRESGKTYYRRQHAA